MGYNGRYKKVNKMGRDNKEREEFVKRRDGIFLKEKTITKFNL